MLENPRLGTLLPEALDYLLSQQLIPVIQEIIRRALEGSAKHGELILKVSGLLQSEQPQILQVFGNRNEEGLMTSSDIQRLISGGRTGERRY
jgi:hypothetical protein